MNDWLRRWGFTVLVMAAIFGFSSIPATDMPRFNIFDTLVKKGAHFFIFGALAASVLYGRLARRGRTAPRNIGGREILLAVTIAALYGVSDEFHQSFVPGRGPQVTDVLIDTAGALTAALTVWRLSFAGQRRRQLMARWFKVVAPVIVAALATIMGLLWQRDALSSWAYGLTGEEDTPAQARGLLQLATDVTRPSLDLQPDVPIRHAGVNPYGINTFLEQEVEPAKRERQLQLISEAGFAWIRQEFPWYDIEIHAKNDFEDRRFEPYRSAWDKYDNIVELAGQHGLQIIARLSAPPEWSRYDGTARGAFAPPDNPQDYADYAAAVAARYAGRITYFQIWNEPNIFPEWGEQDVDPGAYTELLCGAYQAIKQANPEAIVLAGALAPTASLTPRDMNDFIYLERMYAAGAGDCFDIMSVQGYGLWSGPTDHRMRPLVINYARNQFIRDIMVQHGDAHKAIWISEMNWNAVPPDSGIFPDYGQVTLDQQARFAPQAYERAQQDWPWVGVVSFWFFKRAADYERGQSWYYFRMAEPDFTLLPVYDSIKEYTGERQPLMYAGYHQEDHWAIRYSDGWQMVADADAVLGQYAASTQAGATLDVWFEGDSVVLVTAGATADTRITYQLDGESSNTAVLSRNAALTGEQRIPLVRNLSPGPHHLRLIAAADNTPLRVDGLIVQRRAAAAPWLPVAALVAALVVGVAMRRRAGAKER